MTVERLSDQWWIEYKSPGEPPQGADRARIIDNGYAMPESNLPISEGLLHQIENAARMQNRSPADVLEDAWNRYVDDQAWVSIFAYGKERAEACGLATEEGVDQAIAAWRKANRAPRQQ
jgi:predicted transcriptional regulator